MATENTEQEPPELQDEIPEEDVPIVDRIRVTRRVIRDIQDDPRRQPPPRGEQRPQ